MTAPRSTPDPQRSASVVSRSRDGHPGPVEHEPRGLRERKKLQQRQRIADTAAELFAGRGYDEVSMSDVARAADVSNQTVYNYFPAKPDLVLDRAEQIRALYDTTVRERAPGTSPAAALRPLAYGDVERFRRADAAHARGEFPALTIESPQLRRAALELRARQVATVADAIADTTPGVNPLVVTSHAAALVWTIHELTNRIGAAVLAGDVSAATADLMVTDVDAALDDLDQHFLRLAGPGPETAPERGSA